MRAISFGDLHLQWIHKPSFSMALAICEAFQPDYIIQQGDLYDMFSFSRFPKKPGVIHPEEELQNARKAAEEFWRLLNKTCKKAKKFQIKGNHCDRPIKLAKENCPELIPLVSPSVRLLYEFDDVTTIHDSTEELVIEDVWFLHGYRSKLGDHCKHNMAKTVVGHTHRGGVFYFPTSQGKQLWELNVGHLADHNAEPLLYRPQKYVHWTRGLGMIDNHGPRFIPL